MTSLVFFAGVGIITLNARLTMLALGRRIGITGLHATTRDIPANDVFGEVANMHQLTITHFATVRTGFGITRLFDLAS
jgi:hypothetical protein